VLAISPILSYSAEASLESYSFNIGSSLIRKKSNTLLHSTLTDALSSVYACLLCLSCFFPCRVKSRYRIIRHAAPTRYADRSSAAHRGNSSEGTRSRQLAPQRRASLPASTSLRKRRSSTLRALRRYFSARSANSLRMPLPFLPASPLPISTSRSAHSPPSRLISKLHFPLSSSSGARYR